MNRRRLALVLLLGFAWLGVVGPRGLAAQLVPLGPESTAPLGPPVGVRSEASDIFDVPWGGSVAWAGNSWLVTWVAAGAPSYDFNTVFIRRFAKKE